MAATATSSTSTNVHHSDGIRETMDSIIVALILAFVFRAFVVEAFIIPTGSMAPTLYGAHGTILCEDCGTEFAYGLFDLSDPRRANQGSQVKQNSTATCPNCKHRNRDLKVNDVAANPESGDRILVLKWPLDTQFASLGPKRWDVTVFKDPKDGETNFIKRLVGLPNEVLAIIDGDVYTAPTSQLSKETMDELTTIAENKHKLLDRRKKSREWVMARPVKTPSQNALEDIYNHLSIKDKPEVAQKSLWFPVYDHDFPPKSRESFQPGWQVPYGDLSGWKIGERSAHFEDRKQAEDNIVLQGETFKAMCSYNINLSHDRISNDDFKSVSDHRVRFVLTPGTQDGTIKVRLAKQGRVFWGTVNVKGDVSIVEEESPLAPSPFSVTGKTAPLAVGKPIEISFENLDYRLSLHVRGEEVLATSRDSKSPNYYGPNIKNILQYGGPATNSPQIHASGGTFDLTHLVIERDVHYFTNQGGTFMPRSGWGSEANPILLREDEYFMLGDNTTASYDSRLWDVVDERFVQRGKDYQLGTVPADQLIGQAFFVYWPSGRRLEWIPSLRFGIIPDVGRMRWIR